MAEHLNNTTPPDPNPNPNTNTIQKPTTATTTTKQQSSLLSVLSWGTREELLLASAVNRHGTGDWDSVANELNLHLRHPHPLFTAAVCRLKYLDLKHRFSAADAAVYGTDHDAGAVWADELRRLRIAELKRELHRYDLSIVSLQLKVKKLKEEKEKSKDEGFEERENSDPKIANPVQTEPADEPGRTGSDRVARRDGSCNGSSNSKDRSGGPCEVGMEMDRVESVELGESVAEKDNSDVQSTARRREKKMITKGVSGNSSGDENQSLGSKFSCGGGDGGDGGNDKDGSKLKSEDGSGSGLGLVDFLDIVRAKKCGSVFERRLDSQETPRYKTLIKKHIDLGMIQKRVEEGQYTDCHTMFYRDLMLLVNNAIVFFSKASSEHKFAVELRQLVTRHFQTHINIKSSRSLSSTPPTVYIPPKPTKPEVTDLKPKLAITGPVIACRKRSSIAGKAVVNEVLKKEDEKSPSTSFDGVAKKRTRDQSFGTRNPTTSRSSPTKKPSPRTSSGKADISKAKADIIKKAMLGNSSSKLKQGSRQGKEDLLLDVLDSAVKRKIFGNSGGSGSVSVRNERQKDQGRGSHNGGNKKPSAENGTNKEERGSPRNKNIGRPPKKESAAAGKRARDSSKDSDVHTKKRQRR